MKPPEKLYKYESFNANTLSNLKNQQIYFSKPISFNDPFDCAIGCIYEDFSHDDLKGIHSHYLNKAPNQQEFIAKFGDQPNAYFSEFIEKKLKELFLKSRDATLHERGVACFSEIKDEILMWSHYADKHKGFCLEFDTRYEPFNKALKVTYSKKIPNVKPAAVILHSGGDEILKMVTTKCESWVYEKEWRVMHREGNKLFGYPAESLTGIYFGAKIDDTHVEIIALIIQGQNPNVKFYKGNMSDSEFGVIFTEFLYAPYLKAKELNLV